MSNALNDVNYVPLDCPVCERMIRDVNDISRYYVSKCCQDCWIGFLEPLVLLSEDTGYLPNSTELQAYREKIAKMNNLEKKSVKP